MLRHVLLFADPWTVTHQALLFIEFCRQEYWSKLPFPIPGDLPKSGIKPPPSALAGGFFTTNTIFLFFHLLHLAHQEILMCLYFKNISHLPWFLQEPIITLVQDPDISTQVSKAVLSLCLKSLFHGAIRVGLLKYKSDYDTFHRKLQKCFISLRKKHKILKWCKRHSGTCHPVSFSAHLHAPLIHDALRRCLLAGPQTPQARSPQSPRAAEELLAWITLSCISHVQPPQSCKSLLGYLVLWSF